MKTVTFKELNVSPKIFRAVEDMGFVEATPIQTQAIELIRSGFDIIGQSQTGTGKTAAFAIPCIEKIDPTVNKVQALVLCPTRELAIQVSEEFRKFLKYDDKIRVLPVYGGQPIERQLALLKRGVHIVIGTPGRVIDHIQRKTLKLKDLHTVILDEADEMLNMGFREDIESILDHAPEERQSVMFSATMPESILQLTKTYLKEPKHIKIANTEVTVSLIKQFYFEVSEKKKMEALLLLLYLQTPDLALVFCNTKKRVDEVVEDLQKQGFKAEGLHGDLKQSQRDIVMKKFRERTCKILVATDVAARGIDVNDIGIVFNFDLPQDHEDYVHRVGRTGRANKTGVAYTFISGKQNRKLREIMAHTKFKIVNKKLPTQKEIEQVKIDNFVSDLKAVLDEADTLKYLDIIEGIYNQNYSYKDIAAALLKMSLQLSEKEEIFEDEPEEMPFKVRLFINVGRKDSVTAKDILRFITEMTGLSAHDIGAIDVLDKFTFLDVPNRHVDDLMDGLKNKRLKSKKITVQKARKRKDKNDR